MLICFVLAFLEDFCLINYWYLQYHFTDNLDNMYDCSIVYIDYSRHIVFDTVASFSK